MITLTAKELYEIGFDLSEKLAKNKLQSKNELYLTVDELSFKKIDEDLYYRNNPDGKDFVPSSTNIHVIFPNLDIIIIK